MKLGIITDIHNNAVALEKVLAFLAKKIATELYAAVI